MTERLLFSPPDRTPARRGDLLRAAALLRAGSTVAFATETVYGLGAHALQPHAVAKIFKAKGRPAWDPLIVHIASPRQLPLLVRSMPPTAHALAARFWPGPLTLLVPRTAAVPDLVTAGRDKVGIRMPAHGTARLLLRAAGVPVAAPSANRFGHVSPTSAAHVLADLDGRIDAVLDSGPTAHGIESTVVEPLEHGCIVYRPGALSLEQLREVVPVVELHRAPDVEPAPAQGSGQGAGPAALPSPGVGIRHYAPRARLVLVETPLGACEAHLLQAIRAAQATGSTGLLLPAGLTLSAQAAHQAGASVVQPWGHIHNLATLAHDLYSALRSLDSAGVATIVCPLPPPGGLGDALRDRLLKAARTR